MPLHHLIKIPKKPLPFPKPTTTLPYGRFFVSAPTELHSPQNDAFRGRRRRSIQRQLADDSTLPLPLLLDPLTHRILHRPLHQIPSLLPHPSPLFTLPKTLPSLIKFRLFCNSVRSISSDSEAIECEFVVVDGVEYRNEVERVCKVINETFSIDRNMEAVLDECGVCLNCDVVLGVLERFKFARKPAFRFFNWAAGRCGFEHDSRSYNVMLDILGKSRQFETMVAVVEEMGEKGLLTRETFGICVKAFACGKERKKAVGVFDLMKKYGFGVDVGVINFVLDALGRAKLVKEAQALFERLEGRFGANVETYTVLLSGWCRVKNLMEAGRVWNGMIDNGFRPDIVAHNVMLEGLLRCNKRSDAIKLFEVMKAKGPFPNARSYTILIQDLCKSGKMEDAVECLDDMLDSGCEPDSAVYTCLMKGFGNQKKMDVVYRLLKEMQAKGCAPDGRTYNSLIKMMTSRHMPDDAVEIYKKMIRNGIEPSIHTYNMIMKSYFNSRNYEMGCAVWEEMKRKGCCPDENSYTVLVGGLIGQGRSMEACKYLEEMIDKGMRVPQALDYDKIKADVSRVGRPNMLEELGQKLKLSGKFEVADLFSRCRR